MATWTTGVEGRLAAHHPGRWRLSDPDRPASPAAAGRAGGPLSVPGLCSAETPPLLAQPGRRTSCRLSGATLPGVRGPAMGFSRPIHLGTRSCTSGWAGAASLCSASDSP